MPADDRDNRRHTARVLMLILTAGGGLALLSVLFYVLAESDAPFTDLIRTLHILSALVAGLLGIVFAALWLSGRGARGGRS